MTERFITNYCEGREAELSEQITSDWLVSAALSLVLIIDRYNETDEGCYTGPSGVGSAVVQAAAAGLLPADRAEQAVHKYGALIPQRAHRPVYLCGGLGDTVGKLIMDGGSDQGAQFLKSYFDQHLDSLISSRVPDEILYGRAGVLMAGKQAELVTGRNPLTSKQARLLIEKMLTRGRKGGWHEGPPLMWEWHDTEYLGAAHGVAGILQALLLYWEELKDDERREVRETAEWMLSIEEPSCPGHWESSVSHVGDSREKRLVHWCHGAPGMVGFLITAHRVLGKEKYLQVKKKDERSLLYGIEFHAALRAGDLIWREGVLKKGPGLCHGVGGNGLVLLQIYGATGDEKWLQRAKCFALMMMDKNVQRQQRTPDSPYSLFEGWAGGLSLLTGISKASRRREDALNVFPFMPIDI